MILPPSLESVYVLSRPDFGMRYTIQELLAQKVVLLNNKYCPVV